MTIEDRVAAMTPERIRSIRQAKKWTQVQLADVLGCSAKTAWSLESGDRPVTGPECVYLEQIESGELELAAK